MAKFNPKEHLMKVRGNAEYLETKWRLVWFREQFPNGIIDTEIVSITDQRAIFRATVTAIDENGEIRGKATGTKSSTPADFKGGYIEKAETGAIGRALAALGFGTQFEPEFDDSDALADSPVEPAPQRATRPHNAPKPPAPAPDTQPANLDRERVMKRLHAVGAKHGIDHDGLRLIAMAKAPGRGLAITSLNDAPGAFLAEIADGIEAKPDQTRVWLDQQRAEQAALMPGVDEIPNPDRFTR